VDGLRLEVMKSLEGFAADVVPTLTLKESEYWQPSDYLPDMAAPNAMEQVAELQARAAGLSDEVMVVLTGDMITEEALPSYAMWIQQIDGVDRAGEPKNAWGDWLRKWIGEENRHGDLLNRYLYLSGRVNMRAIEETIQNLLSDGADIGVSADAYKTFIYTSFQEIATRISHKNVGRAASLQGDKLLARISGKIAGDEHRHAKAYKMFIQKIMEVDPDNAVIAFYEMMRTKITMPAVYMRERGEDIGETFKKFADVAERTKIYTPADYTDIMEHLVKYWDVPNLKGLSDKAEAAQQYLCSLPDRYRKVADRFSNQIQEKKEYTFSWLDMVDAEPKALSGTP
jgi:acyl-[acyl-carrier protein] desaturase